jgi:hypothetical protein
MKCNYFLLVFVQLDVNKFNIELNVHEIRLPSSEILRRVTLLRTDVSEQLSALSSG